DGPVVVADRDGAVDRSAGTAGVQLPERQRRAEQLRVDGGESAGDVVPTEVAGEPVAGHAAGKDDAGDRPAAVDRRGVDGQLGPGGAAVAGQAAVDDDVPEIADVALVHDHPAAQRRVREGPVALGRPGCRRCRGCGSSDSRRARERGQKRYAHVPPFVRKWTMSRADLRRGKPRTSGAPRQEVAWWRSTECHRRGRVRVRLPGYRAM